MTRFIYPAALSPDEAGRVLVKFPDFPIGATDGADVTEALEAARDCLEELIAWCIDDGRDIPAPGKARGKGMTTVAPGPVIAAKAALYTALRDARMSKVGLAALLGLNESEVRRFLDPRHATKNASLDRALAALGKRLEITVSAAPHDIDDESTLDADIARERRARIVPGHPPKKSGLAARIMKAGGGGLAASVKRQSGKSGQIGRAHV